MFYQSRSRNAEANATYLALIQSNPHFAPAYNNLACLAIELKGDLSEALVWAKKAVELQSGEPEYIDTLGQIYRARGDLKNAIAQFGRAAESRPARAEYYYHLGQALVATGAEKDGSKALRRCTCASTSALRRCPMRSRSACSRTTTSASPATAS